jgi:D-tyrosyl-tRNA(Tyr) deacylase
MKLVIQRVSKASVEIEGKEKAKINQGLLVLLGITNDDTDEDINWLVHKLIHLRIFNDENGVMNKSLLAVRGQLLIVSQFTLHASTKKGHRPSYMEAAKPEVAIPLYEKFIKRAEGQLNKEVQTGEFGADMKVHLVNDGPVTIIVDSKNKG